MVRDLETAKLVGTYRLQTGEVAHRNLGYYGNQLFDFSVYEDVRKELLELGRACVHIDYRNIMVLHALWKGSLLGRLQLHLFPGRKLWRSHV